MVSRNSVSQSAPTDQDLVLRAKSGDAFAFTMLSERYSALIKNRAARYSTVVGIDTEDFVQEGMLALFKAVKGFDRNAGVLFKTYAVACINNSMSTAVKTHMKGVAATDVSLDGLESESKHLYMEQTVPGTARAEDVFIEREGHSLRVEEISKLLSDFERKVLSSYLKGHSYSQISQRLHTSTKAVDNALQRVRRKLRPEV